MPAQEKTLMEEAEAPIHGDILEAILSRVPLIDLVPACHVSKAWNFAVFSSLHHLNKVKPWLIVHKQRRSSGAMATTHAYDPRSKAWIQINPPSSMSNHLSTLKSSHSTLLYMLSPSKFSFSVDPLHLTWRHVDAPLVWRTDPVVAVVKHYVIIAGGACDFEDDPLAVEMYNLESQTWEMCDSMPEILKDSAAPLWLSTAVDSDRNKLYVAEKCSGKICSFDPETKSWNGPFDMRPDGHNLFFSVIAFADNRLILVGLTDVVGDIDVKIWEVNDVSFEVRKEMGEMPRHLVDKLKGSSSSRSCLTSIAVTSTGDQMYIYNPSIPEELVTCEIFEGLCSQWGSTKNVVVSDDSRIMDSIVLSCSSVGLGHLQRAWPLICCKRD